MLTIQQTADRLKVSASTIYALVASGKLRSHRVGLGRGVIRISEIAIRDYLDSSTVVAPEFRSRPRSQQKLKHIRLARRPA